MYTERTGPGEDESQLSKKKPIRRRKRTKEEERNCVAHDSRKKNQQNHVRDRHDRVGVHSVVRTSLPSQAATASFTSRIPANTCSSVSRRPTIWTPTGRPCIFSASYIEYGPCADGPRSESLKEEGSASSLDDTVVTGTIPAGRSSCNTQGSLEEIHKCFECSVRTILNKKV